MYGYAPKAVTMRDTSLMTCPNWLKEKDLSRINEVNSWIKLANQNDNTEEHETDRKGFMNEFQVDDKAD